MNKDSYNNISDSDLLEKYYTTGNNQWLGILLQRYTLLLFGVCMKYLKNEEEAKDAVQQIFLKVLTEAEKYRIEYFKSWLYMVCRNHCLMKLRDKVGRNMKEVNDNMALPVEEAQLSSFVEKDNLLQSMETSIDELNTEQKTCVTLFYLQKKSYQDISRETGYNLLQVKSHIQNGKRNLKILVEKKMNIK